MIFSSLYCWSYALRHTTVTLMLRRWLISKAVDKVRHKVLNSKLHSFGICSFPTLLYGRAKAAPEDCYRSSFKYINRKVLPGVILFQIFFMLLLMQFFLVLHHLLTPMTTNPSFITLFILNTFHIKSFN